MPSLTRSTSSALGQVLAAVGAAGNTITKAMLTLDRLTDAGYSHADTFATNTELRNAGSIQDAILDEERRDLERVIERLRHEEELEKFLTAHPDLRPKLQTATDSSSKTKPAKANVGKSQPNPKAA